MMGFPCAEHPQNPLVLSLHEVRRGSLLLLRGSLLLQFLEDLLEELRWNHLCLVVSLLLRMRGVQVPIS